MNLIKKIVKLAWLPIALSGVHVFIYCTYNREALSYGCHKSLFNPYILSYSINHKNITHITLNTVALVYFALYTINAYGNIVTAIVYTLSVIAAGASYYIECYLQHSSDDIIGASGGVYGLIGFTLIISIIKLTKKSEELLKKNIDLKIGFLYIMLEMTQVLNVSVIVAIDAYMFLISPKSAVAHSAHLGGFLSGVLLGCCVVTFD